MEMQSHVCFVAFLLLEMHDIYLLLIIVGMLDILFPPRPISET